jgi:hypothetical protein
MRVGLVLVKGSRFEEALAPLAKALELGQELAEDGEELVNIVMDLLRTAYTGDPPGVAAQLRTLTGQSVPAWMTEPPSALE